MDMWNFRANISWPSSLDECKFRSALSDQLTAEDLIGQNAKSIKVQAWSLCQRESFSTRNRNSDIRSSSLVVISNKLLGSHKVIRHKMNVDSKGIHNKLTVNGIVEIFIIVFTWFLPTGTKPDSDESSSHLHNDFLRCFIVPKIYRHICRRKVKVISCWILSDVRKKVWGAN